MRCCSPEVRGRHERGDGEEPPTRATFLFMAVAPPFQGKGLGSAILEATLKRADELRLPAYLENSNPKNTRLYERAGFVARGNILPEGPPLIAMWREVNTAK